MNLSLKRLWERLRESYWFLPSVMTLGATILAALTLWLDAQLLPTGLSMPWQRGLVDSSGARVLLSTISGSAITVAGVVFSITIVVLNSASTQFGPRLVSNFMDHPGTQAVLGTFLASFVFSLIALAAVRSDAVPEITVVTGVLLGVLSFLVLIYFIHHVSVFIQAERIIADVAEELRGSLRTAFPESPEALLPTDEEVRGCSLVPPIGTIAVTRSGYVESIDQDRLLGLATDHDLRIELLLRPGDFAIEGQGAMQTSPADRLGEEEQEQIARCVLMAEHRRRTSDPEFSLRQLVEIAVRALSPGINDPFTAIACIDHLAAALGEAARRSAPLSRLSDSNGEIRVLVRPLTWDGLLDAAYDQIRQNAAGIAAVTIRLIEALGWIADSTELPVSYRRAIERQLDAIVESGRESLGVDKDLEVLESRYRDVQRTLARHQTGPEEGPA